MKIILAFLLVIFLVFVGYHLSFRRLKVPLFARRLYLTGMEFLFIGLALGPQFANILDKETSDGLAPLSALVLGWIGMLFGFQFEIASLRRFPGIYFIAGFLESFITLVIVFTGVYLMLPFAFNVSGGARAAAALVVAAAAACTAQTGLALIPASRTAASHAIIKFLRYLSSIDGLVSMLALVPVYLFFLRFGHRADSAFGLGFGYNILIGAVIFVSLITLYSLFLSQRREENELALIIIGMVIFISGFSWVVNFSPLLSNFFMGICLVNLTSDKEKIFNTLVSIEKPVYLMLLIFLGSIWQLDQLSAIAAAGVYFLLRFTGKTTGGFVAALVARGREGWHPGLGWGLMGQGGLPLAILYDFHLGSGLADITGPVVGIILIAIIFSDLLSPGLTGYVLKKEA